MSKIVGYRNTDRHCFSQIKFDSRERVLISVANTPVHSIRVIKMLAGIFPYKTIWEFSLPAGEPDGHSRLIEMFPSQNSRQVHHPLDAVTERLVACRSCHEAVMVLREAERETAVSTDQAT